MRLGVRWLDEHPDKATAQRLLLLYAWNENDEGGYLTPTAADGTEYRCADLIGDFDHAMQRKMTLVVTE